MTHFAQVDPSNYRSGFVAVVGRTNVGKSTLINTLLGRKAVITSSKPQTTRNRIRCIWTTDDFQMIFVDTPGLHDSERLLNRRMTSYVHRAMADVDTVLCLFFGDRAFGREDVDLLERLSRRPAPAVAAINRVDVASAESVAAVRSELDGSGRFKHVLDISALTGLGLPALVDSVVSLLPPGPQLYPPEMTTDQSEAFLVAELVREKIFHFTHQEIPFNAAVEVTEMRDTDKGVHIEATINVARSSQKGIILGQSGRMIKRIGTEARRDIEGLLGCPVGLKLWVKERKDWPRKEQALRQLGYPKS